MKFSVIIPARDEEKNIPGCLESIRAARDAAGADVEIIVVANRCTDRTEAIALEAGARVVRNEDRCLSKIRNRGAEQASGDVLVTIDADSRMSPNMFVEIAKALSSGIYVGGGVKVIPERSSLGISITILIFELFVFLTGLCGGLYWCFKKDFDAVGGFNEKILVAEDLDLARRLKAYGKRTGRKFLYMKWAHIVTSCRKFDSFGDWAFFKFLFLDFARVIRLMRGKDSSLADQIFYDFPRK